MVDSSVRVLIVDDDEDDYLIIREMLKDIRGQEFLVEWLDTYQEFDELLEREDWDVIFIDYDLGGQDGLALIREAVKKGIRTPLIMVTGRGRYELDVEAMNSGAADYLTKNAINSTILERVIRYTLERSRTKETLENKVKERTQELQNALAELRAADKELRTQHEKLLQVNHELLEEGRLSNRTLGHFPMVGVITTRTGQITDANREADSVFQVELDELKGKLLSFYIQLQERRRFMSMLVQSNETRCMKSGHFPLSKPVAEVSEWCVTVVPLQQDEHLTGSFYWLFHPVHEEPG